MAHWEVCNAQKYAYGCGYGRVTVYCARVPSEEVQRPPLCREETVNDCMYFEEFICCDGGGVVELEIQLHFISPNSAEGVGSLFFLSTSRNAAKQ